MNATLKSRVEKRQTELANANKAKSMFLANRSHELRTPLNAIIGFGEMMHRQILGPIGLPAYREYAHHIHESGMHLLALVEEMLDLSKVEAGKLEIERVRPSPHPARRESCDAAANGRSSPLEMIVTGAPSAWPVLGGDPVKLKQVFVNLLGNAIKFTHAGGQVTVSGEADDCWLNSDQRHRYRNATRGNPAGGPALLPARAGLRRQASRC